MANQSHLFDLQLFAGEGESQPAQPSLSEVLGQIEETPHSYDGVSSQKLEQKTEHEQKTDDKPSADKVEPAEEEYDEIVYNKQTVRVPVSERQTLLQKGYNYDKMHGKLAESEQKLAEIDKWVASAYAEQGIKTWDELQNALAMQSRKEQLEDMGIDEDAYKKLLENDPELKRLRDEAASLKKQTEEQAINQRLQSEVKALNETYDLKLESIEDIVKLPNAEAIIEIASKTGLPLTDCYLLANREELMQKQAKAAEQKARVKTASKSHVKDTTKTSDAIDLVQIPADVYAMYKELNPGATDRQIREHYAKSLQS